jgi:hypothetical protein
MGVWGAAVFAFLAAEFCHWVFGLDVEADGRSAMLNAELETVNLSNVVSISSH